MMASKSLHKDWYAVLGANPSDSQAELKQKYQKLALLYHPDKQSRNTTGKQVEDGAQRFIDINQAWKILGNEETKKEYDVLLRESELTQMWPVDAQIHLEEMSWSIDEENYSFPCRCGGRYILAESDLDQTILVNCDSCSLITEILKG
ncbi:dnaJ homolog subfamily C member 24 [Spea bombifrons]|uniref:dnaJ homolog subfamily C member 24 n=1 Tax=Spea bombifrons TaxID=233779 RepID=UPI002349BAB4|nr:dnaJ homolog subfamily C member 24 [Spea bombifrons]